MTPLPKRKHTHSRTGKRKNSSSNRYSLPQTARCPNCKKLKIIHQVCLHCGK